MTIAVDIGLALAAALDASPDDVGLYYWDAFLAALGEAIKEALEMQLHDYKPRSQWGKQLFARGEAEGRARGEAEGRARGEAEGRARGEVEGRAKSLLDLLELRGLVPDAVLRQRIATCTDLDLLERWFRRATTARSIEDTFAP